MPEQHFRIFLPIRPIMIQTVARGLWNLVAATDAINLKKPVRTLTEGTVISAPFDLQTFGVYMRSQVELGGTEVHHFTRMRNVRGKCKFHGLSIQFIRLQIYIVAPNEFKLPANLGDFTLNLNY